MQAIKTQAKLRAAISDAPEPYRSLLSDAVAEIERMYPLTGQWPLTYGGWKDENAKVEKARDRGEAEIALFNGAVVVRFR